MSLGALRICIFANEGCVEMRGKRLLGCGGMAREFASESGSVYVARRGKMVGRLAESILICLERLLAKSRRGGGYGGLPSGRR